MPFMEWLRVVKNCSDHLRVQLARRGRVLTAVFVEAKEKMEEIRGMRMSHEPWKID